MSRIKSVSWKISMIVTLAVVIVGAAIAVFMQFRIINEITEKSSLSMRHTLSYTGDECNQAFISAIYSAASLRNFAEANFDVDAFIADAEVYFDTELRTYMERFVYNIVDRSDFLSAAYFAVDPNLTGYPFVCEVYMEEGDYGIEA